GVCAPVDGGARGSGSGRRRGLAPEQGEGQNDRDGPEQSHDQCPTHIILVGSFDGELRTTRPEPDGPAYTPATTWSAPARGAAGPARPVRRETPRPAGAACTPRSP